MTPTIDERFLLDDDQMLHFIVQGYHLVETDFPPEFHADLCERIERVFAEEGNPGNAIYEKIAPLAEVYQHPAVVGALTSILGADYRMEGHRHCHRTTPGSRRQGWHQDSVNKRHGRILRLLAMYYPQDVTPAMGPTTIVPGTQYRNAPTARLATYGNFKSQLPLVVKAGAVAITHYDIWHAAMANESDRPRLMLKFLFTRESEPREPSWRADPSQRETMRPKFVGNWLPIDNQSDAYKHRVIWMDVWRWLNGEEIVAPSSMIKHYP